MHMKYQVLAALMLFAGINVFAQHIPTVSSGKIERIEHFSSKHIAARNVDVWLPEGYTPQKKYAVVYMHDGQMLFDSTTTWNHQAWEVDEVAAKLMKQGKTQDFIVVGIWNISEIRHRDYFPQKPYESLTAAQQKTISQKLEQKGRTTGDFKPESDSYLKFIVEELKPAIDKKYSVLADQQHTFIAGSSMGGLISLYAICEYPKVFGGAACLSTHWPGIFEVEDNPISNAFCSYLQKHLPSPNNHKIYFDYGDKTLDALYPSLQKRVDQIMKQKGYTRKSWITKFYPGDDHSEQSWRKRLNIPFEFLLKK